jgi:cell wall-associated NlpC family hydrolase
MRERWVEKYIGLPFLKAGTNPVTGVDCWNLVRLVLAEQRNITLPLQGGPVAGWGPCDAPPQAFDVVVMGAVAGFGSQSEPHVGVMVDGERLLHIAEGGRSHVLPLQHPFIKARSFKLYRHASFVN